MARKNGMSTGASRACAGQRRSVYIVDDHPLVREGLAALIRTTPDLAVAGEAGCATEAFRLLDEATPDLVMLDLCLPGLSGVELVKNMCAKYPQARVLVLSMHEEGVYAERVLRAGAQGYIMKQAPGADIIGAVRTVLRGEVYVSQAIASRMLKMFVGGEQGPSQNPTVGQLSNRELQVFTSIGSGMSTQEIAAQLSLNVKTIQTYREHIKRKLHLRNATDLIHTATQWVQSGGQQ